MADRRTICSLCVPAALLLLASLVAPAVGASTPTPDDILRGIAIEPGQPIPYVERRYLGSVTKPLVSTGLLRFEPPDTLVKQSKSPDEETAIVDADSVRLLDASGQETARIDLWVDESLRLVFEGLRAVVRGDPEAIRSVFDVRMSGDRDSWALELEPKDLPDDAQIDRIVVTGARERILGFDILEKNGDRTILRIQERASSP